MTPEYEQALQDFINDPPNRWSWREPVQAVLSEIDALRADLARVTAERDGLQRAMDRQVNRAVRRVADYTHTTKIIESAWTCRGCVGRVI
jgi:hypothetical protein